MFAAANTESLDQALAAANAPTTSSSLQNRPCRAESNPRMADRNLHRTGKAGLRLWEDSANVCTSRARALDSFAHTVQRNSNMLARFVDGSSPLSC